MLPARPLPIKLSSRHESGRRFPICAHVEYHLPESQGVLSSGVGRTIYLSSSSVQIETEHGLPTGAMVELAVTWPARLDNDVLLKLQIMGRTVRAEGKYTTINIARYEFRTRASRPRRDPILQRDLAVERTLRQSVGSITEERGANGTLFEGCLPR